MYKACGFTQADRTAGYGRSRGSAYYVRHGQPKAYWVKELAPGGIKALTAAFDTRPLTGRAGPDFNELNMSNDGGLLEYLAELADHCKPKGIRHGLAAILVLIVVARLSGANSVYAAGQFAASMPQDAAAASGTTRGWDVPGAQPQDDHPAPLRARLCRCDGHQPPCGLDWEPGAGRRPLVCLRSISSTRLADSNSRIRRSRTNRDDVKSS